jgi:phosphatidate cytidylyltransferase
MAADPPARRSWFVSELGARVASGTILAIVTLLATYLGGWPFAVLWFLAGVIVLVEWLAITRAEPRMALQVTLGGGLFALTVLHWADASWASGMAVLACAVAAASYLGEGARDRVWAVGGFAAAAVIVAVPPAVRDDPALGLVGVLWMFAVVWSTDVVAYFTGRRLGGPKLWARVSPGKTWSGAAGGLVAGTAAGVAVALLGRRLGWVQPVPTFWIAVLSAFASVVGQAGDLAESAMKRRFGVKDSGHLIPGHGGAMDRLDAFWAVALVSGMVLALRAAP